MLAKSSNDTFKIRKVEKEQFSIGQHNAKTKSSTDAGDFYIDVSYELSGLEKFII